MQHRLRDDNILANDRDLQRRRGHYEWFGCTRGSHEQRRGGFKSHRSRVGRKSNGMKVTAEINEIELDGDYDTVPSVEARCSRCDHCTESYGQDEASIARCLVLLREECPRGEKNFYAANN